MSSFRSIKYQIVAVAALLFSGPYITTAADLAGQVQWSNSVLLGDTFPLVGPGERIEAYIVDGLLHARRLDQNDIPLWHLILAEADPNQPPTLEHLSAGVEVRHANGAYFVRDTFWSSTLAAHRQQLAPEAFASLDTTVRQNGIGQSRLTRSISPPTPAKLQEMPPETFANFDAILLQAMLQELGPEAFASLDTTTLALIQKRVPEAFASLDTTIRHSGTDQSGIKISWPTLQRGLAKWEKDRQLWVALGPHADHWDTLIRLTPRVFVPEKSSAGAFVDGAFLRWDDAQLLDSSGMLIARYVSPAEAGHKQQGHKLVRGATLFNIEVQRWLNPIERGDRLGSFLGKVVVLHFWATWSPESIEQLAHYDELYKKHKDQGLVVIAIHSAEGADDVDAFIAERGYELPIAVDEGASAQRYGIWNWPQSVLIDRDRRLAWLSKDSETPSPAQLKYLLDNTDAFPAR